MSSKNTKIDFLRRGLSIAFIKAWKLDRAFVRLNGMTRNS